MADLDEQQLKTRVAEILNRHAFVGLAVGVVRHGPGRTPFARRLLGNDVALYRPKAGVPVAMRNRCPAPILSPCSRDLKGDRMVCG